MRRTRRPTRFAAPAVAVGRSHPRKMRKRGRRDGAGAQFKMSTSSSITTELIRSTSSPAKEPEPFGLSSR